MLLILSNHTYLKFLFYLYPLFLIFIFFSCSDGKIIPEEKFVNVYTDLVIAQDTSKVKNHDIIFRKYNITVDEYEKTIEYYNEKPERWIKFFDSVIQKVENLKEQKSG